MVSVIVPVYNVEKYLRQCLDSLKAQTLDDVEFVVIDDGSTDGSGKICDEYRDDPRFRVFHTENRGLSAARNRGLDEAYGEWIEFLDSDDWVEPGFCEIPYRTAIENNADLVIFQRYYTTEKGQIKKGKRKDIPIGIITHEQAIEFGGAAAWNKLYRKLLFSGIRYPEGHVCEEVATTHELVYNARQIIMLPEKLIYYRFRKDSITHRKNVVYEQDFLLSQIKRYRDLVEYGFPIEKAQNGMINTAMTFCIAMSPSDEPLYLFAEKTLLEIKNIPKDWSIRRKILFFIWKKNKRLFNHVCKITKRRIE